MKKLWLLGALALALSSTGLIAQEDAPLRIQLGLSTGFGVWIDNQHSSYFNGFDDVTGEPDFGYYPTYPRFYVGNTDGNTQATVTLSKSWGDYGFFSQIRARNNRWGETGATFRLRDAYGWFNLADGMAKITVGRFASFPWNNYGVRGWTAGDGTAALGSMVEVKPIDGLNVGFVVRPTYRDNLSAVPAVGSNQNRLTYALGNTFFGAKYAPDGGVFGVTAGLQLLSQWENRRDFGMWDDEYAWLGGWQEMALVGDSRGLRRDGNNDGLPDELKTNTLGVTAWGGVALNLIDDLDLEIGARFYNLDDFVWSGQIWTNQKVLFDMSPLRVGINMDQVFLSGKMMRPKLASNGDINFDGPVNMILRFAPNVEFDLDDATTASLEVAFAMAPGWKYLGDESSNALSLGFNPEIVRSMGQGFNITAGYDFMWDNQLGIKDVSKNAISQQIYVMFGWSF